MDFLHNRTKIRNFVHLWLLSIGTKQTPPFLELPALIQLVLFGT
jgi:hypothetical protein